MLIFLFFVGVKGDETRNRTDTTRSRMESSKATASTAISTTSTTSSAKSKILPVVLLSAIPLNLWNGKEKVNIKKRTQPYERTSCTNCNKQTGNQQSTNTIVASSEQTSNYSSAIKVSNMFQSPMFILPILSTKSAAMQAKSLPNIFNNQQQQLSTIYHAKKMVADESNRVRGSFISLHYDLKVSVSSDTQQYVIDKFKAYWNL